MSHYENFRASVSNFCNVYGAAHGLTVVDMDAHADIRQLPMTDVIGTFQFDLEVDDGTVIITTMIGVSTLSDTGLVKLYEHVDNLFGLLLPGKTLPIYDASNPSALTRTGTMTALNGTKVMAVYNTALRPMQFVAVRLGADKIVK